MTNQTTTEPIEPQQEIIISPVRLSRPAVTLETFELVKALAPSFHSCRWFGLSDPGQAVVLMLKAADLGLPITAAFEFFDVIEGKPAINARGCAALLQHSGVVEYSITDGPDYCEISGRRLDNGFSHTVRYTLDEAKAAGLVKPGKDSSAWMRFQRDMLYNRAIGRFARRVAPDLLGGLYIAEELRETKTAERVVECDHFMATAGDVVCPGCGVPLEPNGQPVGGAK